MDQGKNPEAMASLQKALQLDSEVPEAQVAMGRLLGQAGGDLPGAEASTREAIRLWPNFAQAHVNLAVFLFQQNRVEEADYHFKYALRLQPDYAVGHFNYGLMLKSIGRIDETAQQMHAAVRADPNHAGAHEALGELNEPGGKIEEAIKEYSAAVRIRPQFSQAQLELGMDLVKVGSPKEAAEHLTQASESSDPAIRQKALQSLSELDK